MGLVLSRISWTNSIFLLPYGLFWLWVLVVAVLLICRGTTRWPTMTDRLSRTASGHDDAEPIATCGSSPFTEGLGPRAASRK